MFMRFMPFWLFVILFKLAGNIHYDLTTPFGEKLLPLWVVGLIMGGGAFVQVLLDVPAGHLLDRFGYRRLLKFGTLIFVAAGVCYMIGFTQTTYIVSCAIAAFGWLFFGPGINAYSLSHATKGNAGKFMSWKDMSGSLGVVITCLILPFILEIPPAYVGTIIAAIFMFSYIGLIFSPKDTERVHGGGTEHKLESHNHYIHRNFLGDTLRAIRRLNPASGLLVICNVAGATFYGAVWFVVPLVLAHDLNNKVLSLGLGIFDFAIIALGTVLGLVADKFNKRMVTFLGLTLFALSALISGWDFNWMFLLFGFLATAGDEMSQLSLWSWLHVLDRNHAQDGAISGVINFFSDLGWALGPILAGLIYTSVGPSWTLGIAALPLCIAWLTYHVVANVHVRYIPDGLHIPAKPHRPRHKS